MQTVRRFEWGRKYRRFVCFSHHYFLRQKSHTSDASGIKLRWVEKFAVFGELWRMISWGHLNELLNTQRDEWNFASKRSWNWAQLSRKTLTWKHTQIGSLMFTVQQQWRHCGGSTTDEKYHKIGFFLFTSHCSLEAKLMNSKALLSNENKTQFRFNKVERKFEILVGVSSDFYLLPRIIRDFQWILYNEF